VIRAIREFNCTHGPCREVQLAEGVREPVRLSVEQMPDGAGLKIEYFGNRKDLMTLGCISRDTLTSAHSNREHDPCEAVAPMTINADPRRRGLIKVSYLAQTRAVAATLPGVRSYCADWLGTLTGRPRLQLVVDNTRRGPGRSAE